MLSVNNGSYSIAIESQGQHVEPNKSIWLEYKKKAKANMTKSRVCILVLVVILVPMSWLLSWTLDEINESGSVFKNDLQDF